MLIPLISVYTIVLGTLSLLSSVVDSRGYFAHWCARTWARLILVTTRVAVSVEGLERVVPGGSYVFVSNHQSHYDTAVLFASLPHQLRIIAKESLGNVPFLGWHLRRTGHILVDRKKPDRAAIFAWADRLLAQGLALIVYPEGTRSADGRVRRFKAGSFQIALQAGLPVVPVSIVGSRRVMRKGELIARPGTVRLVVHEPIDTRALAEADPREFGDRVRRIIAARVDADADGVPSSDAPPSGYAFDGAEGLDARGQRRSSPADEGGSGAGREAVEQTEGTGSQRRNGDERRLQDSEPAAPPAASWIGWQRCM